MKITLAIMFAAIAFSASPQNHAHERHAAGYHKANGFEQVQAYCELAANGLPQPQWHSVIGVTIGSIVVHAKNYEHCMTVMGYAHN